MLGRRLPKNRKFSYEPRYWDPEKEEKEGRRIKFKRKLSKAAAKKRSLNQFNYSYRHSDLHNLFPEPIGSVSVDGRCHLK